MTKFEIKNGKLFLRERTNKDELMLHSSYRRIDLHTKIKDTKKIFDNPVTAIAYDDDETRQHNCEMDKVSVLKALDFWINDKVLQNEKILFLEGNLKDVHEIELKKLIELREFVQKQPNDTIFTRFRGDEKTHKFYKHSSWTVEFFVKKEKLMATDSIISTYGENFRDDGARFDFNGLNTWIGHMLERTTVDDEVSGRMMYGPRHSDGSSSSSRNDWTTAFSSATNHASEALDNLSRELSRSNGAETNNDGGRWIRQNIFNPNDYRIVPDHSLGNNHWKIVDGNGTNLAVGFRSDLEAQRFINGHIESNTIRFNDDLFTLPAGTVTEIVGVAEGPLAPGDLISMDPATHRWRRHVGTVFGNEPVLVNVRPVTFGEMVEAVREGSFTTPSGGGGGNGPDHLLHSNLHPSITAPSNNNNRIQDITFENLTIHPISYTLETRSNNYVITTYAAQNGQYEMTFDLYVTGREIDRIDSEGFRTHTMKIIEPSNLQIDGELYNCASYTIRERIRNGGSNFVPRRFLDMYIDRTSSSRPDLWALGGTNMGQWEHVIHLVNGDHTMELELKLRDRNQTIRDVIRRIRSEPVNVGILDREVTLNGYSFPTIDFPEVTWSSGS